MRHIDAFCHFFPAGLFEKMSRTAGGTTDIGKRMQGVRTIHDLDARLRMMDAFADYSQILSLACRRSRQWPAPPTPRSSPASPMMVSPSWSPNIPTASPAMWARCR